MLNDPQGSNHEHFFGKGRNGGQVNCKNIFQFIYEYKILVHVVWNKDLWKNLLKINENKSKFFKEKIV